MLERNLSVYPFIAVDPRRPHITELVKDYITNRNFFGIKLYPPLGYFPYDERLSDIYQFACDNDIPIISHCSQNGPVFSHLKRGKLIAHMKQSLHPDSPLSLSFKGKKNKEICNYFSHPINYDLVTRNFPKIKICFAHFGGVKAWHEFLNPSTENVCSDGKAKKAFNADSSPELNWFDIIYDRLKARKSFYADISYTLSINPYLSVLKTILQNPNVRNQILFCTDFYIAEVATSDRQFGFLIRGYLGEKDFSQIAEINPQTFLQNKIHNV